MAVNISVGTQSQTQHQESNANDNFDDAADQNAQQDASLQSNSPLSSPSDSPSNGSPQSDNSADAQTAPEPAPPTPPDEGAPPAAFARYGIGDTVVMGAPSYVRDNAGTQNRLEQALEPTEATPLPIATPMPKPGSNMSSPPALTSPQPAPAPTHDAPQISGAAVTLPTTAVVTAGPSRELTFEQGVADLTLGDPLNIELIARYEQDHPNANLVEHGNATADRLVATYGEARLNDLAKLHDALAGVRDDYTKALTAAETRGPSFDNTAFWKSPSQSSGDGGTDAPAFDNAAFTRWYVQQDGLSNRAFAANYAYGGVGSVAHSQGDGSNPIETTVLSGGTSVIVHERVETSSEGGTSVHVPRFAAPGLFILGGPTSGIELHDPKAVWFDPTLGFVTSATNVVVKDDFMDRAMPMIMAVGFMAVTGLPSTQLIEAGVITAGNTIAAGAVNGAIGSFVFTGASGGELTFKGIFQGALTGGIMGALSGLTQYQSLQNLGLDTATNTITNYALRAVSITGQATIQGALRELVGGRFRDGFTQGLAQGLAGEIMRALNGDVAGRLARGEITADQARALNQITTMTGSAIRAAANPNDPAFAFAQDYLTQLLGAGGATTDSGEVSPALQAEIDSATIMYRIAVDEEDYATQDASVNRLIAAYQQSNPGRSNQDAINAVSQRLGVPLNPDNFVVNASGRLVAIENISSEALQTLASADADLDSLDTSINENIFGTQVAAGNGTATDAQSPLGIVNNPLLTLAQRSNLVERDLSLIDERIAEFTRLEADARASGNTALANRYQNRVDEFLSRQSQYREAYQMLGTARTAQSFSESLYSNNQGYNREQIDAAMNRILRRELPVGGVDDFVRNQMVGNNPGLWASLNDPEGLALIATVGSIGRALTRGTPSVSNYRDLFRTNRPDMPPTHQVHHTLPKQYGDLFARAGINIHEVQYLRGVDVPTHITITNMWGAFHRQNGGNPTINQIQNFARQIDQQFGSRFVWPK